jgi:bacterioferritin-associated ferredoxin
MKDCCDFKNVDQSSYCGGAEFKRGLCPRCGRAGQKVENVTVKSLVEENLIPKIGDEDYFLCSTPQCDVVYYNNDTGKTFCKSNLKIRVGFKEIEDPIPVCYCANVTEKQIRDEIVIKKRARNMQDIKQYTGAMTGGRCKYMNPSGKCCGAAVNTAIQKALTELEGTIR